MIGRSGPRSVTILAPVRPDHEERLALLLRRMAKKPERPFASVPSTHFARFVLIPALLDGEGEPAGPPGAFLLFGADFDGSRRDWMYAIAEEIGAEIDAVLRHCAGYPGSADRRAFASYLHLHNVRAGFSVICHDATVAQIRRNLALQRGLRELAGRSARMTARELQDEWTRRFAG